MPNRILDNRGLIFPETRRTIRDASGSGGHLKMSDTVFLPHRATDSIIVQYGSQPVKRFCELRRRCLPSGLIWEEKFNDLRQSLGFTDDCQGP